ncbi:hypothetical protein DBR06_SOUSAS1210033, partial [Sousa chinensis]
MGDPEANVMARRLRAPLRRSFSDHIRDSTARALDVIWKNTRDRRLAEKQGPLKCQEISGDEHHQAKAPRLGILPCTAEMTLDDINAQRCGYYKEGVPEVICKVIMT